MKKLLVVIDMVNGFVNFGALADSQINKITPTIINLIEEAKREKTKIIAFKDCHSPTDEEFKVFPPHCLKGEPESDLIPELKKYEKDMLLIEKNTTNGFITHEFTTIASEVEFDEVYVVGCCTDICVKDFVTSYLKFNKANNRKTQIYVIEDACYTFDGQTHNAQKMHKESINEMKEKGATIIRAQEKIKKA